MNIDGNNDPEYKYNCPNRNPVSIWLVTPKKPNIPNDEYWEKWRAPKKTDWIIFIIQSLILKCFNHPIKNPL